jgi:hypothetical protein
MTRLDQFESLAYAILSAERLPAPPLVATAALQCGYYHLHPEFICDGVLL